MIYWGKHGKICKSWAEGREEGEQGKTCVCEGYFLSLRLRPTFILGVEGYNKCALIKGINHFLFEEQVVNTGKNYLMVREGKYKILIIYAIIYYILIY